MQQYIVRPSLLAEVAGGLSEAPAVALLGARQVGKTTLARRLADEWPGPTSLFDLEVAATREALTGTPERVLGNSDGLVVIDEIQRMPGLFEVLRPICDQPDRKAVFLLLGSASWDLIKGVSETLAGRILFVGRGRLLAGRGGTRQSGSALDARRLSARMAGTVFGGVDTLDALIHEDVSGAGRAGAGLQGFARLAGAFLAHAGALPRTDLERGGIGTLDGRERFSGEPLP